MKREVVFYIGIFSILVGGYCIGLGIGKLLGKVCEGQLIGVGVGLLLVAVVSIRSYRRLVVYSKDNV